MPLTVQQHNRSLAQPPLCEQLKVRDIVDDLLIQVNGSFVAGYKGAVHLDEQVIDDVPHLQLLAQGRLGQGFVVLLKCQRHLCFPQSLM